MRRRITCLDASRKGEIDGLHSNNVGKPITLKMVTGMPPPREA